MGGLHTSHSYSRYSGVNLGDLMHRTADKLVATVWKWMCSKWKKTILIFTKKVHYMKSVWFKFFFCLQKHRVVIPDEEAIFRKERQFFFTLTMMSFLRHFRPRLSPLPLRHDILVTFFQITSCLNRKDLENRYFWRNTKTFSCSPFFQTLFRV